MRRSSSTIPFGYALDKKNKRMLTAIPEQLKALDKIVDMVKEKTLSLREGAMYLEHQTGRQISHMGLKKIADKHA
tara:strand:- start:84 stop:308 length:225 start_codon:yes stop_codon:yes gene_type:complete